MDRNNNTVPSQEAQSSKIAYDKSGTVLEASQFLEHHWQKLVALVILLIASLWFFNEYRTNQRLRTEQASLSYSRASTLLQGMILGLEESAGDADVVARYLDEIELLTNDYADTPYGKMAQGLRSVFTLSRSNQSTQSIDIDMDEIKNDLLNLDSSFEAEPVDKLVSELRLLMYGRYLLDSTINEQRSMAYAYLTSIIRQGDFFPVEAAVTYYLSVMDDEGKREELVTLVDNLVVRYPQIEEHLLKQFSKYGVTLPLTSSNNQ